MRITVFLLLIMNALLVSAQQNKSPKTVVFKVRAPATAVSVFPEDSVFWLEKNNKVRIKIKSDKETKVSFTNGKVISQDDGNYIVKFDSSGNTVITVHETDGKRRKLLFTASYKVKEPEIYFCGVKVSTWSNGLKMRGVHFQAYSIPLDTMLKVVGYQMIYHNGIKYKTFASDNDMLTNEMTKVIFEDYGFPTRGNEALFFANIKAEMPDGSIKTLQPITLSVLRDSTNQDELAFKFAVQRLIIK